MTNDETLASDDLAFIEATYAQALGRAPEPRAVRAGLARLQQGLGRDTLLLELRNSDEGRNHAARLVGETVCSADERTVARLLLTEPAADLIIRGHVLLTGHAPSREAAAMARCALAGGQTRLQWLRGLRRSAAARVHCSPLADVHKLDLDADELAGARSADLARLLGVSDEAFVHLAYWRLLHRAPDRTGRQAYLRRLRAGQPRERLLREIIESPEGRARGAILDNLDLRGDPLARLRRGLATLGRRVMRGFKQRHRASRLAARRADGESPHLPGV